MKKKVMRLKDRVNNKFYYMAQDTFLGYLRTAMNIIGSLLIGHVVFGHAVDNTVLESVIGGALSVSSTIWGVAVKTATLDMVSSSLSKVITFAGGLAVEKGIITGATLVAVMGATPLIAAEIMKRVQRQQNQNVATGKTGVSDLAGVKTIVKAGQDIVPVVTTPTKS